MTPSHGHSESVYYGYGNPSPVEFGMDEEVITEPIDSSRARESGRERVGEEDGELQ